jgi:hypothetical protein
MNPVPTYIPIQSRFLSYIFSFLLAVLLLICFTKQILNSWIHTVTMRNMNPAYEFLSRIYCTYPITKKADAVYNSVCICKWKHAKSKLSDKITGKTCIVTL